MNRIKTVVPLAALMALTIAVGCATFEGNTYKTLSTIANTVEAARKGWVSYVTQQRVVLASNPAELAKLEQQVAKVGVIYAEYQTSMRAANDAITAYRNGKGSQDAVTLVISAVSAASGNIIALIGQLTSATPTVPTPK